MQAQTLTTKRENELEEALREFPGELFQFDERIGEGWFSDRYFVRAIHTLELAGKDPVVTMQVFAKKKGVLAGVFEALQMLRTQLWEGYTWEDIEVETLLEGDEISPKETVMLIKGPYKAFAHLETPILGVIARRSLVASNVRLAIEAARGKPIIFMPARHDDWRIQTPDGYAARVGGLKQVSSDAGGEWWGNRGVGTMPHALIAAFDGDVVEATLAFAAYVRDQEPEVKVVSLVDYNNSCGQDAVAVARAMEERFGKGSLGAVRLDTSESMIDEGLAEEARACGDEARFRGVTPELVKHVRRELDEAGFSEVGIVVSGGFTPKKISKFEDLDMPVDAYGVGSSLLGHTDGNGGLYSSFDFTGDLVAVNGKPQSKKGRQLNENPRLVPVREEWLK